MNVRGRWVRLSQYGFPFHPPSHPLGNPTMHRLRIAGRKRVFESRPYWKRFAAKAAMTALWPVGSALTAVNSGLYHKASAKQVLDAWWLALRHNVPPLEYFVHQLWDPLRRARLDDYLYWTENGASLMALNRAAGWTPGPSPVEDKCLFSELCASLELPTPSVFCVWQKGVQEKGGPLPKRDLWLKPVQGRSGVGSECWRWREEAYQRRGRALTPSEMTEHVAQHSRLHTKTLVQAVVQAHPNHAPIVGGAPLCTRIITGRRRSGKVEVVDAMACWPREDSEVTQGGHVALVDVASGRLGTVFEAPRGSKMTGLGGSTLPDWQAALNAVCKGHENLAQYVFLGWDVAFGPSGPVLLETNSGWGSFHFQLVPDRPIADTVFAEIAAEYV